MGYAKLFSSITQSSLWSESKDVRLLFVSMLANVDQNGYIEAAVPGLASLAHLMIPEVEAALAVLEAPDPYSKNPAHDGRRIAKVPGGWILLNYEDYRNRPGDRDRREYMRKYMQERRKQEPANIDINTANKVNDVNPVSLSATATATATATAETKARTHSVNARLSSATADGDCDADGDEVNSAPALHSSGTLYDPRTDPNGDQPTHGSEPARRSRKNRPVYPASFEAWYANYPRHVGKGDAAAAYGRAIKRISASRGISPSDAHIWLIGVTQTFAKSPAGTAGTYTPHPATWLNQARYDDDPAEWNRDRALEGKPNGKPTGPGQRFDPAKPVSF